MKPKETNAEISGLLRLHGKNERELKILKGRGAELVFPGAPQCRMGACAPNGKHASRRRFFTELAAMHLSRTGGNRQGAPSPWLGHPSLRVDFPQPSDPSKPPTVWFPVVRAGDGSPSCALENNRVYTLSFRYKSQGIVPDRNHKNTLRVLLSSDGGVRDLMYLQGPLDWNNFAGGGGQLPDWEPEWEKVELVIEPGKTMRHWT